MRTRFFLLALAIPFALSCISCQESPPVSRRALPEQEIKSAGTPDQLQYWISGLLDCNEHRRQMAIRELGGLRDPRALPHLLRLVDSDYDWDRIFALQSINLGLFTKH